MKGTNPKKRMARSKLKRAYRIKKQIKEECYGGRGVKAAYSSVTGKVTDSISADHP